MKHIGKIVLAWIIWIAFFGWLGWRGTQLNHLKKVRCSNFKTQTEAEIAFKNGAKQLDGNKNGIACESLTNTK